MSGLYVSVCVFLGGVGVSSDAGLCSVSVDPIMCENVCNKHDYKSQECSQSGEKTFQLTC